MNLKVLCVFVLIFWMSQVALTIPFNDFRSMPRSNSAILETEEVFLGDPIDYQGITAQDTTDPVSLIGKRE